MMACGVPKHVAELIMYEECI